MPTVALADMEKTLEQVLRREFGEFGLDHVELTSGFDHDGDPSIFVTAVLPLEAPLMPGEISGAANVAVAQALREAGDDRISYLYIRRPDDERPIDEHTPELTE